MTIEFVSNDFSNRNVKERLKKSLEKTKILRGAVAFWTLDFKYFGQALIDALDNEESFYCVDVSSPTNFDAILDIHNRLTLSPAFHVHCKRFEPKKGIRENLLHSKIIVMDKKDGSCEIWVGSHNFTNLALSGINIESSVVIQLEPNEQNNSFKNNIIQFLNDIVTISNTIAFDKDSYYLFKALQDAAHTNWIKKYLSELLNIYLNDSIEFCRTIEIEGKDLSNLQNSTIIVIGDDYKELSEIEGVGAKVIIHAHNNDGTEIFYRGFLRARDKIDTKFSKDVQFGERRIGKKESRNHKVVLEGVGVVKKGDLDAKGFYVNIEIVEKIPADKKILVYSHPDFTKLWYKQEDEIFASHSLEVFQNEFLPKLLYKVIGQKKVSDDETESQVLNVTNFYDKGHKELDYMPLFKRRIYIMLALSLFKNQ